MFLQHFVLLLTMLTCVKGEMWKLPTATDIRTSLETCQIADQLFVDKHENDNTDASDIRCIAKELGLWTDDEGFKAKRIVKLLNKYHQPIEIVVVIGYCNNSHKQTNLDKWANEAYHCFARGRMGLWINEYIRNLYKKKITNK